ncbi:MAG: hypothetical protein KGM24_04910, partial [Elusimicrobia bacterium]|nr:hypothetical protein [Elusimicrobiota bacterium]
MSGWLPEGGDRERIKLGFAVGALLGLVVVAWLAMSRASDDALSGRGFDLSGPGSGYAPAGVEKSTQTGLSFVRFGFSAPPSSARPETLAGGSAPSGPPTPPAPAPAASAAAAPAASSAPPPSREDMAAAGVPTDKAGLSRLGAESGLLSKTVERLIDHPRLLHAIFDSDLVVDGLMGRDSSRRNCSDPSALTALLSNPNSEDVTSTLGVVKDVLNHPDTAAALADTKMAQRILDCPSVKSLQSNPAGAAAIVAGNPAAIGLVADPRVAQALADNPQATAALGAATAAIGGAAG